MNINIKNFFVGIVFVVDIMSAQPGFAYSSKAACMASLKDNVFLFSRDADKAFKFSSDAFLGKKYTSIDASYRTLLPLDARDYAVLLQAIPSKDNKVLALVYVTCILGSEDKYKTYVISVDTNSWKGGLITMAASTIHSNYRAMSAGDGWIGSTHLFIITDMKFDPGVGSSCAYTSKTVFDMISGKKFRTISAPPDSLYYNNMYKLVGVPSGCEDEDPNKIFSIDVLTGKTTNLKQGEIGTSFYLNSIKQQNDKWILYYKYEIRNTSNSDSVALQELELP